MNMNKYLKFIIFTFFITIPVHALELCTPTKEYLDYQKLSEEEKANLIEPTYCSELINNTKSVRNKLKSNVFPKLYASASDSSYNSYTEGYTTSPKDQYQTGLCWDFSTISVVEANAKLKGLGTFDLSEAHLAYSLLSDVYTDTAGKKGKYNGGVGDGGKITYAPSYFYGGYGQLLENNLSFTSVLTNNTQDFNKITSSTYPKGKNILSLDNFYLDTINNSGACTASTISTIKANVIKYGSTQAMMYMDQDLFKDANENYYISKTTDSEYSNHAVTIVGWDDSISKSNFGATQDGAWIIKNSWGEDWSDDGFFYISYDDEQICNLTANYETSEKKDYDHTYRSSDVVGIPTLTFNNTLYMASKFSKESTIEGINEKLEKVSYMVGENMSYKVYLSTEENLNDKTKWTELASGSSSLYGIKSTYLNNIEIPDSFMIILEYQIPSSKTSSVFTTCDNLEDNNYIDFTANKDFISLDGGSSWTDMSNISISSTTLKCQPNIYVYTKETSKIELTDIVNNNNNLETTISMINVDTNNIEYKIENSKLEDVTSHFEITPNYETNKITIASDNKLSGTFKFIVSYEDIEVEKEFELEERVEVKEDNNTSMLIEEESIYVVIDSTSQFTYKDLIDSIDTSNTEIIATSSSDEIIEDETSALGTGSKVKTNDNEYIIVVIGDVSGDGKVNSQDLLKIVKHLKNITTLTEAQLKAADCNYDNQINSQDLLKVVKHLKNTGSIKIKS